MKLSLFLVLFLTPATSSPALTTEVVPILPLNMVDFLGLELSSHDAEVALYVIFVFLLVSVLGIVFVVYGLQKALKKSKKAAVDAVKMERL